MEHPKILHNGVLVHTTNSEGKPIHPTEQGIRNFHDWFGNSKVVDEHGRPQVVYHGTHNDINTFDIDKASASSRFGPGMYFTNDKNTLSSYAGGENANIMPVYLKAENMKTDKDHDMTHDQIDKFFSAIKTTKFPQKDGRVVDMTDHFNYIKSDAHENPSTAYSTLLSHAMYFDKKDWANGLHNAGIHGIKRTVFGHPEYMVNKSNQIKSAIGNSGEFSRNSNKLTESFKEYCNRVNKSN